MMLLFMALMFVLAGGMFVGISLPLIQKRIKPNLWYGFRVPKTLNNLDIWYAANAYMARRMILVGVLTVAAAVLLTPLGLIPGCGMECYTCICTAIMMVGLTWTVIASFIYLSKL